MVAGTVFLPGGNRLDVINRNRASIFIAQQVFQQHFHGNRKSGDITEGFLGGFQTEVIEFLTLDGQCAARFEAVPTCDGHLPSSIKFPTIL